ncbi:MAG TPA: cyclase family protein [Streptosporangiaceae bacterium]|nr:cyclase family protein [Streptosporangiaceae bacterium]
MTAPGNSERPPALDSAAFSALYQRLRRATPWGPDDRRGGLNYITRDRVLAAAAEVRLGRTVTLEAPIETWAAPDNPEPAMDEMTGTGDQADPAGLTFARDRLTMNVHGNADSHIDALCHVMYQARLYNGVPADTVTSAGAAELSIEMASNGIVGRGVLLDVPRLHGVPWLEPGDHVTADDLTRAEEAQGVRVGEGDLLLVRVGHRERRNAMGPWNSAASRAGLHPTALEFVAERKVAVLGSDSNNDTSPTAAEGVDFPVHVLAINAMGLHLLDWLQFDDLVPLCAEAGRWSFCCVIAPLRLVHGTGSPVNPIAIL